MSNHELHENHEKKLIRYSTAEFLIFTGQAGEQSIEARYEDETIWLTQKLMAELFAVDVRTVSECLKNIFQSNELLEDSVIRKFRNTATDGKSYLTRFYNLDAIISVGYRVNSVRATQFCKDRMGLTSWENTPNGKILKTDVPIAKNYPTKEELDSLGRIVNAYLELAEERALRKIPMTMEDWSKRLDMFLEFADRNILANSGKVTAEIAKAYAKASLRNTASYRIGCLRVTSTGR